MPPTQKPIYLSGHARGRLHGRGTTEQEVIEAVRTEPWQPTEHGRFECRRNFSFNAEWNGKYYATKQVRPISADEPSEIVVVTVYVYYFWGGTMKITYDREVDALYIQFKDTTVTTQHLAEGIAADYDADGRLAGIEILDAIKRLGDATIFKQVILEDVGLGHP